MKKSPMEEAKMIADMLEGAKSEFQIKSKLYKAFFDSMVEAGFSKNESLYLTSDYLKMMEIQNRSKK